MRERLIGAIVLVVIAVILVPWLISRSHHPRDQVRSLPLPPVATAAAPSVLPLPALPKPTPDPSSTSAASAASATRGSPAAATRKPTAKALPEEKSESPPRPAGKQNGGAASNGAWNVQVASFSSHDNAAQLAARLAKAGFHAFLSPHEVKGKTWYRVRVGPYPNENAAQAATPGIRAVSGTRVIVREDDGSGG